MPLDGFVPGTRRERPLRIALFSGNYNYTVDGANRALNRLVGYLQSAEGARVRVYSPTGRVPAFAPMGELVSVPSVPIPTRTDYRLALGMPSSIRRDVEAFAPDVIHLSAPDLLGSEALKLAQRLGIATVASLHTHFDTYLDYYGLASLRPFIERRLNRFYRRCDFVLAPTPALAQTLERDGLPGRTRVWTRGVDTDLFNPARRCESWRSAHGFAPDQPVLVFFGRLVMEKGLAMFADVVDRLEAARGPLPVLVIGDGPARAWFGDRLPNAVFTGFLSDEPLATAVANGDIFFNPSVTESFGNVTLEAMASGLAAVCADAPSSRALLDHERTGLLCDPKSAPAYAAAIGRLLEAPAERQRFGRLARRESAGFCWEPILAAVAEVYREALALHPAAARLVVG